VKIDKNKLNTLLRSGLNPEIKTRKQLAAQLGLDPTSLTRWFATRDRLGNPRYPVVPDRHVTKILALFNLSAQALSLDEEEFRQHCFELSLQFKKGQNDLRQKNVALRKLNVEEYSPSKNLRLPFTLFSVLISLLITWFFISTNPDLFEQPSFSSENNSISEVECWQGFSSSLGDFSQHDNADPCHYGKLFHRAINQLKAENESQSLSTSTGELSASRDYLLFLSKQLDERRLNEKIVLNLELGKNELRRLNYLAAQNYFQIAGNILNSSNNPNAKIVAEIAAYKTQIETALK